MPKPYTLSTPLSAVAGIGPTLTKQYRALGWETVQDLLLFVPLRYEDRSTFMTIDQLKVASPPDLVSVVATVVKTSQFQRGRRSIQAATIKDETGQLKAQWFNSSWVLRSLQTGDTLIFSGKYNPKYRSLTQPKTEVVKSEQLHTGRLVPVYSQTGGLAIGRIRRLQKEILDQLTITDDWHKNIDKSIKKDIPNLEQALRAIHFPDQPAEAIQARQRLALEELLSLISHAQQVKTQWQTQTNAVQLQLPKEKSRIPKTIPFELTGAQQRATDQILADLTKAVPMNRLLIGDVGAGKTVVAGLAIHHLAQQRQSSVLVAPTQILAEQHAETIQQLFPNLKTQLVTSQHKLASSDDVSQIDLFIGTHAVLKHLTAIQPALIIYDEQHRFGVRQRQTLQELTALSHHPHILTMTATPIPRTLMLSIFSHLAVSVLDELPANRVPTKTWLVPSRKHTDSYHWLLEQLAAATKPTTGIVVCPFIKPSTMPGFEKIPAVQEVSQVFEQLLATDFPQLQLGVLHSKLSAKQKAKITQALFDQKLNLLITTPVIEVGLDVPSATYLIIEGAERFGLASLHQLRGRVGRAGQQGFCLLHTSPGSQPNRQRLKKFASTTNGLELAQFDLEQRGAGDLFGTSQHGFDQLRFAEWTNVELVATAQKVYQALPEKTEQRFVVAKPLESDDSIAQN